MDFDARDSSPLHQFSSPVVVNLLQEVVAFAAHRAAAPVIVDGQPLIAIWIEVAGQRAD